jgi:putative ABC transport system substrate-binding protein
MRRREFILGVGAAAAATPTSVLAQQQTVPVVGVLGITFPHERPERLIAFRKGLSELGFVEGKNVAIEYRWAEGHYDRFPELAFDLVRRQVALIAALGSVPAVVAAKSATKVIPIVFAVADDPVKLGLVESLSRPEGNATGINFFTAELVPKRMGLLHELLPQAKVVAVLRNPDDVQRAESLLQEVSTAARSTGFETRIVNAATAKDLDSAFVSFGRDRPDALFVGPDIFFNSRRVQLAILAAHYSIPTTFAVRDYVEAGGLMSYGTDINDAYRQVGVYAAQILRGAKPTDLPVLQPTRFELVINMQTARTLGVDVPPTLLARADEVIE